MLSWRFYLFPQFLLQPQLQLNASNLNDILTACLCPDLADIRFVKHFEISSKSALDSTQ